MSVKRRIAALEEISSPAEYVVRSNPGETAEEAVARGQKEGRALHRYVAVVPQPCETAEEWTAMVNERGRE